MKNNHTLLKFYFARLKKPIPFNLFIYGKSSISSSYTSSPPLLLLQSQRILLVCFKHRLLNTVLLYSKCASTNSLVKLLYSAWSNISPENISHYILQNCHLFPWLMFNHHLAHLGLFFFYHINLMNHFCLKQMSCYPFQHTWSCTWSDLSHCCHSIPWSYMIW